MQVNTHTHTHTHKEFCSFRVASTSTSCTLCLSPEHPEMAALLFTCSVCVGLLLTLLAVSIRVSCRPGPIRCLARARSHAHHRRVEEKDEADADGVDDDDEEEEDGTSSSLISTKDRKSFKDWEEVTFVCEAAERAERMERREMVMQEIWMNSYMNGAPDV